MEPPSDVEVAREEVLFVEDRLTLEAEERQFDCWNGSLAAGGAAGADNAGTTDDSHFLPDLF